MEQIKLTKTELRTQQLKLAQLQKYLPTLQLKKSLLQLEVNQVDVEIFTLQQTLMGKQESLQQMSPLFSERGIARFFESVTIDQIESSLENVAGVEVPILGKVLFKEPSYSFFDTPMWYEKGIEQVRSFLVIQEKIRFAFLKKEALEGELRAVSIRVNLFEKNMIPRAIANIKKIKIFLGDQQLAAVAQAKVAKKKIQARTQTL